MELAERIDKELPVRLLPILKDAARFADEKGQGAAIVGGVVRDLIMGRSIMDADIMIEDPVKPIVERLAEQYKADFVSHERFMTFTLNFPDGGRLDVATARDESYFDFAALPEVKATTLAKDLKRRDFTINAMALRLNKIGYGELLDPMNGRDDIKNGFIRAVREVSFHEDPTRIYRGMRFAGRFNFMVEPITEYTMLQSLKEKIPQKLSATRRRHELELILKEDNPLASLVLLHGIRALEALHPDLTLEPAHKATLDKPSNLLGSERLVERLVLLLKPLGKTVWEKILLDLAFEKTVKKQVLEKL